MYNENFAKVELFKLKGQLEGLWELMGISMENEEMEMVKILRMEIDKTNTMIEVLGGVKC